ncbi:uncharacterized protein LOC122315540 isoform X2 [Carya illinoinensis]|uniref:uncharacterized protein LOC122315540 isoform X2 n=1 Tax=Carya illinoinensis TaxID=32201 RepID=UPI001C718AF3|nr:uncharacterized protein LOC122315540 isoform X2 [Carya illinoinensis]
MFNPARLKIKKRKTKRPKTTSFEAYTLQPSLESPSSATAQRLSLFSLHQRRLPGTPRLWLSLSLSLCPRFPRFFVISARRRSQLHAVRVDSCRAAIYSSITDIVKLCCTAVRHKAPPQPSLFFPSPTLSFSFSTLHLRSLWNVQRRRSRFLTTCLGIRLSAVTNEGHRSLRDPSTTPISSATDDFVRNRLLPQQPVEAAAPQVQEHGTIQFVNFHRRVQSNTASSLVSNKQLLWQPHSYTLV